MSDITALLKIVEKDFELPEPTTEEGLRVMLIQAFEYLIDEDFPKIVQILYRADVDQDKLKMLLETSEGKSSAEIIADAYLVRQKVKIETWKKYSAKN
jgi:hypothetical protein